ncbi:MAG: hypothetical protein H6836_01340 [Planctomycetes bacterium]|nr:hypothetical protein [Planctomycetota bacterium]
MALGFLGAALTSFLLTYEIRRQSARAGTVQAAGNWFSLSIYIDSASARRSGIAVRRRATAVLPAVRPDDPVATVELSGTDGWIKNLMTPVLESKQWNCARAGVLLTAIMLVFSVRRRDPAPPSPPALLCLGRFVLRGRPLLAVRCDGDPRSSMAFVIYALGRTYYWPCVLISPRAVPRRGGALTL